MELVDLKNSNFVVLFVVVVLVVVVEKNWFLNFLYFRPKVDIVVVDYHVIVVVEYCTA